MDLFEGKGFVVEETCPFTSNRPRSGARSLRISRCNRAGLGLSDVSETGGIKDASAVEYLGEGAAHAFQVEMATLN